MQKGVAIRLSLNIKKRKKNYVNGFPISGRIDWLVSLCVDGVKREYTNFIKQFENGFSKYTGNIFYYKQKKKKLCHTCLEISVEHLLAITMSTKVCVWWGGGEQRFLLQNERNGENGKNKFHVLLTVDVRGVSVCYSS